MSSAKLIEPKYATVPKYRKKFCVEIDLDSCNDVEIEGIIQILKNDGLNYNFMNDIINIIERKE